MLFCSVVQSQNLLASFDKLRQQQIENNAPSLVNEQHPVLSNFRILNSHKNRIYFDSSVEITNNSSPNTNGFILTQKTITGVVLNNNQKTGHYFTVDSDFNFYSNTTIRYTGFSTIVSAINSKGALEFNLTYIENNINEPTANTNRYVSLSGDDSNDGLTEATAWRTLAYADSRLSAGMTLWIKAGDYGDDRMVLSNSGTANNPIKIIGYQNNIGEAPSKQKNKTTLFDGGVMPYIHKTYQNTDGLTGIDLNEKDYIFVKNIMMKGYYEGIDGNQGDGCLIENVYIQDNFIGINFWRSAGGSIESRIKNCLVLDSRMDGILYNGLRCEITDCYVGSTYAVSMDYYIVAVGSEYGDGHHIVRNCVIDRFENDTHGGHGVEAKKQRDGTKVEYCLFENIQGNNIGIGTVSFRHHTVRYNVARNITATSTTPHKEGCLVYFRDNCSYNIVENSRAINTNKGVRFNDNIAEDLEDPSYVDRQAGGHHNTVVNTIFDSVETPILDAGFNGNKTKPSTYNSFIYCTFFNSTHLYKGSLAENFDSTNKFVNSIIHSIGTKSSAGTFNPTIEYSNLYNSFSDNGNGNVTDNPNLTNVSTGDFTLTSNSPNSVAQGGIINSDTNKYLYDYSNSSRSIPTSIGAHEYGHESILVDNKYVFNGNNDCYLKTDQNNLLNGIVNQSWVFYMKINTHPSNRTFLSESDSTVRLLFRSDNTNQFDLYLKDFGTSYSTNKAWQYDEEFHQFVITYSKSRGISIYIDGALNSVESSVGFVQRTDGRFLNIGQNYLLDSGFRGEMKRIKFYGRELSQTEVTALNSDLDAIPTGLIADFNKQKTTATWTSDVGSWTASNKGSVILQNN